MNFIRSFELVPLNVSKVDLFFICLSAFKAIVVECGLGSNLQKICFQLREHQVYLSTDSDTV